MRMFMRIEDKTGRKRRNGFTPVRRSAEHGFTLVELMVVIDFCEIDHRSEMMDLLMS